MGVLYPATFVSGYSANPPPLVEPQIIYIEAEQGTPRLGHTEFDPLLMAQPGPYPPLGPGDCRGRFYLAKQQRDRNRGECGWGLSPGHLVPSRG